MKRLLITLLAVPASIAAAQARPTVPTDERVYRDIDRLAAAGLLDTVLVGARPFSEREVVRLLTEAQRNAARRPGASEWARRTIEADLQRWARADNGIIEGAMVEAAEMDSPYRVIDPDPNGRIDASINPLAGNRAGRTLSDGFTGALETFHSAVIGSHLALSLNPRLALTQPRGGAASDTKLTLHTGAIDALFGNVALEAGRDYAVFGQAPGGGTLLSDNAQPLDMVRVSSDEPFVLPWIFRHAGPARGAIFLADLGKNFQIHPHSRLVGYEFSVLPSPRLELGLQVIDAMGGNGGQPGTFPQRLLDAFPMIDVLVAANYQFSNKMAAANFHWRAPEWNGFEVYGELAPDDFDIRRVKSILLEDSGYLLGAAMSCITECGRFGVRAEYRQTGIRFYTASDYPIAQDGQLLGDPLGPRGLGGYLTLDGESAGGIHGALNGAFEVRSGNGYASAESDTRQSGFHFIQVFHRPGEKRARLMATVSTSHGLDRFSVRGSLGMEHVTNYAFVAGAARNNALASLALVVRP